MKIDFSGNLASVTFGAAVTSAKTTGQAKMAGPADAASPLWAGHYVVETHGRTETEIVAEIQRLEQHHAKKSTRLAEFHTMAGTTFDVDGVTYTWSCLTVWERGTDVELYANAVDGNGVQALRPPFRKVYATIDDVPANEEIAALVAQAIRDKAAASQEHAAKIAAVSAILGG